MPFFAALSHSLLLLLAPVSLGLDSVAPPPNPWLWFPVVTGAPETGFGGGLVLGWFEGGGVGSRPSSAVGSAMITSKGHRILSIFPELYLFDGRFDVAGELQAQKYPDLFYGVGGATTGAMEEAFTSRSVTAELAIRVEARPGLRVGGLLLARHDRLVETEEGALLSSGSVSGSDGGTTIGVGLIAVVDTRDNLYAPRAGVLWESKVATFAPALGSDYGFRQATMDLRHYLAIGGGAVLGTRAYGASSWGDPPFYAMPQIGAQGLLRGYREGRFRDRAAAAAEFELRIPLTGRFGAVLFGGVGGVAPDLSGLPGPADLERTVGAGFRFRLNDGGVNLRVDYGVGREGGGLYLGIGEAF